METIDRDVAVRRKLPASLLWTMALVSLTLFLLKGALAPTVVFHADEFYEVFQARRIVSGELPYGPGWVFAKTPLFWCYLALAFWRAVSAVDIMLAARFLMLPFSLLMLYCLWWIGRRWFDDATAMAAVFSLSCCTTFIDRSIKLRTDMISTSIWVLIILLLR